MFRRRRHLFRVSARASPVAAVSRCWWSGVVVGEVVEDRVGVVDEVVVAGPVVSPPPRDSSTMP